MVRLRMVGSSSGAAGSSVQNREDRDMEAHRGARARIRRWASDGQLCGGSDSGSQAGAREEGVLAVDGVGWLRGSAVVPL